MSEILEESCPPALQETGIQASVLAVDPTVAHEPAPVPLSHHPGSSGKHCLRWSPTVERIFVEIQVFSREVPAQHWSKIYKFRCTGEGKRNSLTLPVSPFQGSSTQSQERTFYLVISLMGESDSIWINTQFLHLCRMLLRKPIYLLLHQDYSIMCCINVEQEKAGRVEDGTLIALKGGRFHELHHGFHLKTTHVLLGMPCSQSPLNGPLCASPTHIPTA